MDTPHNSEPTSEATPAPAPAPAVTPTPAPETATAQSPENKNSRFGVNLYSCTVAPSTLVAIDATQITLQCSRGAAIDALVYIGRKTFDLRDGAASASASASDTQQ